VNKNRYLSVLLAFLLVTSTALGWTQATAPTTTRTLSATERKLVDNISVASIKETVTALAADEMQGRGTAQVGGDKAAAYLADRFAKLGLKPLGAQNTYLQPINFKETQVAPESTITAGNQTLKLGPDFFVLPPFSGDENVNGGVVFVGYGAALQGQKRNDLVGVDVRGKVVVLREGPPPEVAKDAWTKMQGPISHSWIDWT
jgi:hypothetical protein